MTFPPLSTSALLDQSLHAEDPTDASATVVAATDEHRPALTDMPDHALERICDHLTSRDKLALSLVNRHIARTIAYQMAEGRFGRAIANVSDAASFEVALDATRDLSNAAFARALQNLREAFSAMPFEQRDAAAQSLRVATATLPDRLKTSRHREPEDLDTALEAVTRGENAAWVAAHLGFDSAMTEALQHIAIGSSAGAAIARGENVQDVSRRHGITHPDLRYTLQRLSICTGPAIAEARRSGDVATVAQRLGLDHPAIIERLERELRCDAIARRVDIQRPLDWHLWMRREPHIARTNALEVHLENSYPDSDRKALQAVEEAARQAKDFLVRSQAKRA